MHIAGGSHEKTILRKERGAHPWLVDSRVRDHQSDTSKCLRMLAHTDDAGTGKLSTRD